MRRLGATIAFVVTSIIAAGSTTPALAGSGLVSLGSLGPGLAPVHPNAISADGSTIVGRGTVLGRSGPLDVGFVWTRATGATVLNQPGIGATDVALDVSATGDVIVGGVDGLVFRWTQSGGWFTIPFNVGGPYQSDSTVRLSADGQTVLWSSHYGTYRWHPDFFVQPMLSDFGRVEGISADGSIAAATLLTPQDPDVGFARSVTLPTVTHSLSMIPDMTRNKATAISDDGTTVVGYQVQWPTSFAPLGCRWTDAGVEVLGTTIPGARLTPRAVCADGTVVVGQLWSPGTGDVAFIWDAEHGARTLGEVLQEQTAMTGAGWRLRDAIDISADGQVITGIGYNPCGTTTGWIAWLNYAPPVPSCLGDANCDLLVDGADLSVLLNGFGNNVAAGTGADGNADGVINGADLSVLLSNFGRDCSK